MNKSKGFTLVEILIVVAIIGVLAAAGMVAYGDALGKGRDAKRKGDLKALAEALELYYSDKGEYPETSGTGCTISNTTGADTFKLAVQPYMKNQTVPDDPKGQTYCYYSENNGGSYRLFAKLDNCSDSQVIPGTQCGQFNYSEASSDLALAAPTGSSAPPPPPGSNPPPGPNPPPPSFKRVFITSTTYNGNLGGLTGADAKCGERADAASLGGTWKAWVSDSTGSPSTRFSKVTVSYMLVDGNTVIANNWNDLITNKGGNYLRSMINKTELNTTVSDQNVWTHTTSAGTEDNANRHCNNWSTTTGQGSSRYGHFGNNSKQDSGWTEVGDVECNSNMRLYCFEQ